MSTDAVQLVSPGHVAHARSDDEQHPELSLHGQFILGRHCLSALPGWARHRVPGDLWLMSHPTLSVTHAARGNRAIVLVGYILDPADASATDQTIATRLLESCDSIAHLIQVTGAFGGRWIVLAACDDGMFLFNDALGLRQVYYTDPSQGAWAMSQPGLAAVCLNLPPDPAAVEFIDSHVVRTRAEYHWPAASAPLQGLHHLLPNHYLDLRSGTVARFWPVLPSAPVPLMNALDRVVRLLPGMLSAAAARFDLALAVTAGLDSRLLLAASRHLRNHVTYVTVRQAKMNDDNEDIVVPSRLLRRLGLSHEIVRARSSMSADFSRAYKRRAYMAHDHYGADAEAILAGFGRRKMAVTGSGAEVGRCAFRQLMPFSNLRRISAGDLAWLEHMEHPFAVQHFQAWLDEIGADPPIKILDLLEWEQGHGNWLAMTQLEFDIAWQEILTPYNCRDLLTLFLSVSETYRRAPDYRLFTLAIRELWPEVLSEPVNPSRQPSAKGYWINRARTQIKGYRRWWQSVPALGNFGSAVSSVPLPRGVFNPDGG